MVTASTTTLTPMAATTLTLKTPSAITAGNKAVVRGVLSTLADPSWATN